MNERNRVILAIVVTGLLLLTWQPMVRVVERVTGWQLLYVPPVKDLNEAATQPSATQPNGTTPIAGSTTGPAGGAPIGTAILPPPSTQAGQFSIASPATMPAEISLGSAEKDNPTFALQLNVSPVGGALSSVVLNAYTQKVDSPDRFTFDTPYGDGVAPLATRSITINGQVQDISHSVWSVEKRGDNFVTLGLDITDGKHPLLSIYKQFTVRPRSADGSLGYETGLTTQFVNHTDHPMTVSTSLVGPTFPPSESARGGDRQVIAGYQGKNVVVLGHDALESFSSSKVTKTYADLNGQPMLWFGAGGNYFNAIVRPDPQSPMWFKETSATLTNPESTDPAAHEVVLTIQSIDWQLPPGGAAAASAEVFFGPRLRSLLNNPYYTAIGYNHTLELGGSSCTYCTFQWLVDWLMGLLSFFQHYIFRDWGLSIIALVFLVRALLHPITKRSQVNMSKMSELGPQMEKLKQKYKDDKEGLNRAMMQFYKQQGAAPVLGCLPMFLQMPIWIALYSGLSSTFELRQAPFLYGWTWIHDLAKPDHLVQFTQPVSLLGFLHFDGINIIPILMAGAFFMQQKLTPKPPATTPEQQQQQKMMQWMTLLFPVMLYSSPSGLNLYILTSTTFGIIESRIIRKHIAERKALQPTGPTFVDGEIIPPKSSTAKQPATKPGGIMGWLAGLQEKAEQLKNDAERQQKNKKR